MFSACKTTSDLNLEDPAFFEKTLSAALEGEAFRITADDYPAIQFLLADNDPKRRRAGVLLAGQANDELLYPDIFAATLDENPEVAKTAVAIITENDQDFREYLLTVLESPDPPLRSNALLLLSQIGGEDLVSVFIRFFDDPDERVRNQASLAVHAVADRKNPFLQEALNSPNTLAASIAYRTLGRYSNPNDTPFFIAAFTASDPKVQKEAQLAALRQGEAGLPFLHIEASDKSRPFDSRVAALNVMQGLRSSESLMILFQLLADENAEIRANASGILGTYGAEAIPALAKLYETSNVSFRIHAIQLMEEVGASAALPVLVKALADSSPEVGQAARTALESFGTEAWPHLRHVIEAGDSASKALALQILLSSRDPWLVHDDSGEINQERLFVLITVSDPEELANYLDSIKTSRLIKDGILSLKEAWNLALEFSALEAEITSAEGSYLYIWRQREIYAAAARESLRRSFVVLHQYFETRESSILDEARIIREESRRLESKAHAQKVLLDSLSPALRTQGQRQLAHYTSLRNRLVQAWEYMAPEMRDVALAIYADRGLNPKILSRESALLGE